MIRKTLTTLSLIGLLLSGAFWVRAPCMFRVRCGSIGVDVFMGALHLNKYTRYEKWEMSARWETEWRPLAWRPGRGGFSEMFGDGGVTVSIPLWIPALLFAILPCYHLLPFHRRRKRKKLGLCVKCGYDLRGSKDRCPECGKEM